MFKWFKKHDFDLENPEVVGSGIYKKDENGQLYEITYTRFHCIKCGKTLALTHWDMHELPRKMKYGCIK